MLVLSRKVGEQIIIDEKIVVRVLEIQGNRVRIGIAAPSQVHIVRGELEPLPQATRGEPELAGARR